MEFESLKYNPESLFVAMGIIAVVLTLFAIAFAAFINRGKSQRVGHDATFAVIGLSITAALAVAIIIMPLVQQQEINRLNQVFINNVMAKYDIDSIDEELSEKFPANGEGKRFLITVSVDGKLYEFLATYDAESGEPTLIDPAIKGGQAPTEALTADELIRS